MRPDDWLLLCRTVRFGETDAAGVMHFHQLLRWCHEAYEAWSALAFQRARCFLARPSRPQTAHKSLWRWDCRSCTAAPISSGP
jgi:hypothetical protein